MYPKGRSQSNPLTNLEEFSKLMKNHILREFFGRRTGTVAGLLVLAVGAGPMARAAGTYTLGGLVGAITGSSDYGWDGDYETDFRAALQNTANFGPSGTVTTTITTTNVTSTGSLTGINGLVVPWWYNSSATPTQVNQVVAFFEAGGDLLMGDDDSTNDPVAVALGLPTIDDSGETWTAQNLLATGPFGTGGPGSIAASGDFGYLSSSAVTSTGGIVGAVDGSGNVTAAYWPRHAFCPTCGAMVIICDVDVWTTEASYGSPNGDSRFSLNSVAFLLNGAGNPISSAPPTTPVTPSFWLGILGLAALVFYVSSRKGLRATV